MSDIVGKLFHPIIKNIFHDVKGIYDSDQLRVNCPRCQEKDDLDQPDGKYNLEINTEKGVFRCWKCSDPTFSGTLRNLIRLFGNSNDLAEFDSYRHTFGFSTISFESSSNSTELNEVNSLPHEFIPFNKMDKNNPDHVEAYMYIVIERGIKKETLHKYKIGFCVDGFYKGRIIIPSHDANGQINYFLTRAYKKNIPPHINPKAPKDNIIFNDGYINWDSTLFILEGAMDYLSLDLNSTLLIGKEIGISLLNKIKIKKPNVVIILDGDAKKDARYLYDTIETVIGESNKVKIVFLKGNDDINVIFRKNDKKGIKHIISGAKYLSNQDYYYSSRRHYGISEKQFKRKRKL